MKNDKESKMLRRIAREAELAQNHVGVLNRAQTFVDRKKKNDRNACKDRRLWA